MDAKRSYYATSGMKRSLARRYFREFAGREELLDVGCGTGAFGQHRPEGVRVCGVDADPGALEIAARYEDVRQVDLESEPLPFADDSFDGILAKDVLEHLAVPARLVRDLFRVLRPGGIVVASLVMANPRAVWSDYTHVRGFTRRAAVLLFADAGFSVETTWRMGPVPLADRLRFMDLVPYLLQLPGPAQLWATSWELRARKPR